MTKLKERKKKKERNYLLCICSFSSHRFNRSRSLPMLLQVTNPKRIAIKGDETREIPIAFAQWRWCFKSRLIRSFSSRWWRGSGEFLLRFDNKWRRQQQLLQSFCAPLCGLFWFSERHLLLSFVHYCILNCRYELSFYTPSWCNSLGSTGGILSLTAWIHLLHVCRVAYLVRDEYKFLH